MFPCAAHEVAGGRGRCHSGLGPGAWVPAVSVSRCQPSRSVGASRLGQPPMRGTCGIKVVKPTGHMYSTRWDLGRVEPHTQGGALRACPGLSHRTPLGFRRPGWRHENCRSEVGLCSVIEPPVGFLSLTMTAPQGVAGHLSGDKGRVTPIARRGWSALLTFARRATAPGVAPPPDRRPSPDGRGSSWRLAKRRPTPPR